MYYSWMITSNRSWKYDKKNGEIKVNQRVRDKKTKIIDGQIEKLAIVQYTDICMLSFLAWLTV